MWSYSTALPEVALRVAIVYLALLVMIRVAGKRELGQLGPMDLLAMLLLSETVSPALTAQDPSLPASLTASATLLALTAIVGRLTYHSKRLERWIDGAPVVLVRDAKVLEDAMRSERISEAELEEALRRNGLEGLGEVRLAVAEQGGNITVVKRTR
jgi:uncharacterized membrane protein YcaP (DUF421 family)